MADLLPRDRLIVALDVSTPAEAERLIGSLVSVTSFKVGTQLFTAAGPEMVRRLARNRSVFLDLKFHDIPTTVAAAVRSAGGLGVKMLTVHASGGSRMMKAAVEAWQGTPRPLILAVTVLTSLRDEDMAEIGVSGRVLDQTLRLAALAKACGCDGVIASPREVAELRREMGEGFVIVTPGIRPAGSAAGDQARAATATEAIEAGANYLVVGRPVTEAPIPGKAAGELFNEIADVLK